MEGIDTIQVWSYRVEVQDPGDLAGYTIHARDGEIGKVDKHDMEAGRAHLLVSTGPWIFGKTVMLPAGVIQRVDDEHETVDVSLTKDQIKNAPEYDEGNHADNDYRDRLGGYYGSIDAP